MWVFVTDKFAAAAKSAAIVSLLFIAACAENKPEGPSAQASGGVEVGSTQDFLLNVGDRVFFNDNSAELSPTATAALDKQAVWLARYTSYTVNVEGHSDEKGNPAKNKKLSVQRAEAVKKYLVSKGVDASRIRVVSFGRDKRVATCNDISCWSQNRRVVTVLQTAPDPMMRGRQHAQAKTQAQTIPAQARAAPPPSAPVYYNPPPVPRSDDTDTFNAPADMSQ